MQGNGNKSKGLSKFLFTETYNGACKVNGKIFSVVFTVGVARFHNTETNFILHFADTESILSGR